MRLIDAEQYEERINAHINAIETCPATSSVEKNKELRQWKDALYDLRRMPTINPYEWISVEDRLPKKQQEVIVCRGHHSGLMSVYTYLSNNEWEDDYGYWGKTNDEGITHWMPLPESPTEKEN